MALHMLAVFGPEIAHPPTAMLSPDLLNRPSRTTFTPEERLANEAQCSYHLHRADAAASAAATAAAAAASPSLPHSPADTRLLSLGKGSGFFFARGPFCSYASRNGVHALLAGEVGQWPGVDPVGVAHNAFMRGEDPPEEDDAHWLLDFYDAFRSNRALDSNENDTDGDVLQEPVDVGSSALEWLSQLRGGFAVIIYDSENHRVMTARDAAGAQSLYWGCGTGGQLLFGSSPSDLEGCAPTATAFPAGSLFVSEPRRFAFQPGEHGWVIEEGAEAPGRLLSFVRADAVSNADDVDVSFAPPASPLSPSFSMSSPRSIHAPHSGIFASPRSHGSAAAVYHDATISHGPPPKIPRTGEEEIVIGMDSKGHPRFIPHRWRAVKAIPRINSQGVVCGAVYRVASTSDNLAAAGGGLLDDESIGLPQSSSPLRPTPSMGEVLRRQRHEAEEAAKASAAAAAAVAKAARIAAAEQAAKETMILMHNRFPNNWPEEHLRITGSTVMRITG